MMAALFSLLGLLLLSALFSASETSITAIGHGRILAMREEHHGYANLFEWLLRDSQRVLTLCLIINNIVNIGASVLAATMGIELFGPFGAVVVVPVMTVLIVVFGEILPKSVAMIYPDKILLMCLPLLRVLAFILTPVILLLQEMVRLIGMLFKVNLKDQRTFVTRDEVERMVTIGEKSGIFEADEREMIHGIISFEETRAYEIMVPRTDMIAIPKDETLQDAIPMFTEEGHSRIPVYDENLDDIVGILYVKDTLKYLASGEGSLKIEKIMRKPMFVPDSIHTDDLLKLMKKDRVHIAIAVDEYGGVAGIVTMEDILEEIVGEIQDEFDQESAEIEKEEGGTWLVSGMVSLEDLSEALASPFESEDAESLGGLVLSIAGNFPKSGEKFKYGDWTIEVLEVEDHRIKLLRLISEELND